MLLYHYFLVLILNAYVSILYNRVYRVTLMICEIDTDFITRSIVYLLLNCLYILNMITMSDAR